MGSSILTNRSAMTALQTLQSIGSNLDKTQKRVSTGLAIGEAADNTAYWSISSMMKSDSSTLSAVSKALDLGLSQVNVANETISKSKEYLDNISASLTTGYQKGEGDIAKIQADIKSNMENISSSVYTASLAEKNMLATGGEEIRVAGAYRREGSSVYVDMINVGGASLNFATAGTNPGDLDLTQGILKGVFGEGSFVSGSAEKAALDKAQADYDATKKDRDILNAANAKYTTAQKALDDKYEKAKEKNASHVSGTGTVDDPFVYYTKNGNDYIDVVSGDKFDTNGGKTLVEFDASNVDPNKTIENDALDAIVAGPLTDGTTFKNSEIASKLGALKAPLDEAKAAYNDVLLKNIDSMTLQSFVDADLTGVSSDDLEMMLKALTSKVAEATQNVVTAGATLGAAKTQITSQIDYVGKLVDAIDTGVGSLVDADMNKESARLSALQVQQQLGIQALSIANQNSQNILALFQG